MGRVHGADSASRVARYEQGGSLSLRSFREKATPPKTLVQEVPSNQPGVRVFVIHSDERLALVVVNRLAVQ
jgi:hypothetical protein